MCVQTMASNNNYNNNDNNNNYNIIENPMFE